MRPRFRMHLGVFCLALATLTMLPGCRTAEVAQPLTGTLAGNEPEAQMEFWHTLAGRPVTSNDEAFHALLLFMDGEDPAADYAGRVELLQSRNMLPASFDAPAHEAVTRGVLAVSILRLLEIRGGIVLRAFGPSQRYALRELQYQGVFPESSPHQTFSGSQFIGVIGRVEDQQRIQALRTAQAAAPADAAPVAAEPGAKPADAEQAE